MIDMMSIVETLRALDDRGSQLLADGTLRIRKDPPRPDGLFPDAFLHWIFPPLTAAQVENLSERIAKPIPEELHAFYLAANGLSVFSGSMSIRGLRGGRVAGSPMHFPVSLEYGNTIDRPEPVGDWFCDQENHVRFGFYSGAGGRELVVGHRSRRVYLTPRYKTGPVLFEWANFGEFLSSEVERMAQAFSERKGRVSPLDPLPPPDLVVGAEDQA